MTTERTSTCDEIEVALALDTDPREVAPPDDFATALDAKPQAHRFFEGLSNSQKQWLREGRSNR